MIAERRSIFVRAAALKKRLARLIVFDEGGQEWAEPIPPLSAAPAPWCVSAPVSDVAFLPRKTAVPLAYHLHDLLVTSPTRGVLYVYTDGAASSPFGRCGAGVAFLYGSCWREFSSPVGVCTPLSAELCAIRLALVELAGFRAVLQNCVQKVWLFSDSKTAIRLVNGNLEPKGFYQLVSSIRAEISALRREIDVLVSWSPGHCGILGNTKANSAAKNASSCVDSMSPKGPIQPLIPFRVSDSLLRFSIGREWQRSWSQYYSVREGRDCLGRIFGEVGKREVITVGTRREQSVLAKLRLGYCSLNGSRHRWCGFDVLPLCECGLIESVAHFLLACPSYALPRLALMATVSSVFNGDITEEVLLGSPGVPVSIMVRSFISTAVADFVRVTNRF